MKIGVIGGGAVGLLISSLLADQGHQVTIYVRRQDQKHMINKIGIEFLSSPDIFQVRAMLIDELQQEDFIFICVKYYQIEQILTVLKNSSSTLIFIQNGMGHIDLINKMDFASTIIVGTFEHGALKVNDYSVIHTGKGKLNIALLSGNELVLSSTYKAIDSLSFPVEIEQNWHVMLSEKLVINAVINPLTALFQVKNGEILTNPHVVALGKQLCKEAASVLQLNAEKQWRRVIGIAGNTNENESSMKMDLKNNQLTEIEGISGYLLKHASVDIPYTRFVYQSIKALECYREREDKDG
ncbi:2-dehydropantoate 2-reductase [Radiobacillus sp. PE A8.2]|uniref:2-dehydropantoate 2-reductase n=1 Tax=Radiobacillus sp. PE A8.2 TaxID=3380349 RepID=UPI00388F73C4